MPVLFVSFLKPTSQEEEVVNKYQEQYERFVSLLIYVSDLEYFTRLLSYIGRFARCCWRC